MFCFFSYNTKVCFFLNVTQMQTKKICALKKKVSLSDQMRYISSSRHFNEEWLDRSFEIESNTSQKNLSVWKKISESQYNQSLQIKC